MTTSADTCTSDLTRDEMGTINGGGLTDLVKLICNPIEKVRSPTDPSTTLPTEGATAL